ncbi:putative T7SS-secreted protein [Actinomycetospora flava]|uniref:T7SS-secreted protein n=1 Tax=Actinomycetospora flava TaxID=3129232 RepID=A0ABU8M625_9PSEU
MAELGATEDPAALVPGNPIVLRTAGETYRRYAQMLGDAAAGLGRLGTPEGWSGPAADRFRAAFAPQPQRWQDAATAFGEAVRVVDAHAEAVEWARGRAGEAVARWQEAQAASTTARAQYDQAVAAGATAIPFVDPGDGARADAQAILAQARQHVRDSGDAAAGVVTAACAAAPAAPGFWGELADGAGAVAAGLGNAGASLGNALLNHPGNVAAMFGGGALASVSAVGVAGSVGVTATGVGAPVGVPFGALSAAGVATGAAIAGLGAADTVQHALTDDRVAPFSVAADADAGEDAPLAPADRLTSVGVPGAQKRVRELPDEEAVVELYEELAETGKPVEWTGYAGQAPVRLEDGTIIGLRQSNHHASTIDVKLPNGEQWKVHIPR